MRVSKNGGTPNHPNFERFGVETPPWRPPIQAEHPSMATLDAPAAASEARTAAPNREMAGLPMDRVTLW